MEAKDISAEDLPRAQEPPAEPGGSRRPRSRRRSMTIFMVVSVINVALLVLLWTQLLTPARTSTMLNTTSSGTPSGDISSPLIGKPAPDFTLPILSRAGTEGENILHLAAFQGKPVMLNFWASWCEPCNQEAPLLQKAWPGLQSQGIILIGIDGPEKTSDAQQFLQKYGITYRNVQDTINGTTAMDYGVTGFPEMVFINKRGIVVAKWIFPLTEQGLRLELSKMAR